MWDEEGLEPLGGTARTLSSNTTHHMGSFDSDLNSIVSKQTSAGRQLWFCFRGHRQRALIFQQLCHKPAPGVVPVNDGMTDWQKKCSGVLWLPRVST